jgi:cold shock protein
MVTATVREWNDEEGWGVFDCPETPGGCFGHYSDIQATGFHTLSPGQQVDLTWEAPGFNCIRGGSSSNPWRMSPL